MNVAMAFQFFGAADAMEILKEKHPDLEDSEGSIRFCRRVKALITAMNCREYKNHLKPENESWKNIKEFLTFIREWEKEAKDKNHDYEFITNSTCYGLKISLQAILEISEFLVKDCGFDYLMTARLNQDALERFFGMMRHCCGSNDHPDSTLFIQMYKLVSTYSLVKPSKGSNIEGSEIVQVLLNIKDITNVNERKIHWDEQIDTILDKGRNCQVLSNAASILEDHDYFECSTSDYVLAYVSGFVVRKSNRFSRVKEGNKLVTCQDCFSTLVLGKNETVPEFYKLIDLKSKGYLYEPSLQLFHLISALERATLSVIQNNSMNSETLFEITDAVEKLAPLPILGCVKHKISLTHNIIRFYLTTRMFFISKQVNKNENIEKERSREKRKMSKLVTDANSETVNSENIQPRKKKRTGKLSTVKNQKSKVTENSTNKRNPTNKRKNTKNKNNGGKKQRLLKDNNA